MKILTCVLLAGALASANSLIPVPLTGEKTNIEKTQFNGLQQNFETLKDIDMFIKDLNDAIAMGADGAYHTLGVFYLSDHKVSDGVFLADIEKGIVHLQKSANKGYAVSSSFLALYFLQNGEHQEALNQLRHTLVNCKYSTPQLLKDATLQFASIVLDISPYSKIEEKDIALINEAIHYLKVSETKEKDATAQFLIANLYHKIKNEELANIYLNISCNNTNKSIKIEEFCKANRI